MNKLDSWEQDGIERHQHVNPINRVPIVHVGYYGLIAVPITSGMMPSVLQWTSKLQYIYILDGASDYRGLQLKHALWSLKGRFQHNMNKVTRTNTESKQPRLMEHGTTCMSCWTPNAFYWQPPKKNLGQITLRYHQIWLAGKSTMYRCVVYRWFPQLISDLLLVRGFQIATFDDRKDPEGCRWKNTLHQIKSSWPSGPSGIARTRTP
jgi:hypothetical protein